MLAEAQAQPALCREQHLIGFDLGFHGGSNGNSQQSGGVYSQQVATNAVFTVNGVSMQRSTNSIADALPGSLDVMSTHASGSSLTCNSKGDAGSKVNSRSWQNYNFHEIRTK